MGREELNLLCNIKMEDSVADIELRKQSRPKFPSIKNGFLLLLVSFGATMDRTKALIITFLYFVLVALFA